jgi:hypothetical protein
MKDRIRELWAQCVIKHTKTPMNWQDVADEFAELIVRECAEIGDNYQDILGNEPECANCRKVAYGIVDKIKQHFGVEE